MSNYLYSRLKNYFSDINNMIEMVFATGLYNIPKNINFSVNYNFNLIKLILRILFAHVISSYKHKYSKDKKKRYSRQQNLRRHHA